MRPTVRASFFIERLEKRIYYDANPLAAPVLDGHDPAVTDVAHHDVVAAPAAPAAAHPSEAPEPATKTETTAGSGTSSDSQVGTGSSGADSVQAPAPSPDGDPVSSSAGATASTANDGSQTAADGAHAPGAQTASPPPADGQASPTEQTTAGSSAMTTASSGGPGAEATAPGGAPAASTPSSSDLPADAAAGATASTSSISTAGSATHATDAPQVPCSPESPPPSIAPSSADPVSAAALDGVSSAGAIDPMIGENFTFTVTLDNTTAQTLYGPYIDLYFPTAGHDGDGDGLIFDNATYLGSSLTTTVQSFDAAGHVTHPYAVDASGTPIVISGTPGDTYVTLQMPFGSFTPTQPAAEVTVTAHFSSHADIDPTGGAAEDASVVVYNGFQFGADPLDNPGSDLPVSPTQVDLQTFRPEVVRFQKNYVGTEQETATGPNYIHTYSIEIDVADGQTLTNLQVLENLPNSIYYLGDGTVTGGSVTSSPGAGVHSGQQLVIDVGTVTGGPGVDRVVTFAYYVPYVDAGNTTIVSRADGSGNDDQAIVNDTQVAGDWDPIDPDDAPTHLVMNAEVDDAGNISGTPDNDEQFDAKAIAIQKAVSIASNSGNAGFTPGDVVAFTLNFQVSDYFNFGDILITDVLPDGLDFLTAADGYAPTFAISDAWGSASGQWTTSGAGTNLIETPMAGDDTQLQFLVSHVAGYGANGILRGTLSGQSDNSGDAGHGAPATGTITYYARINEQYLSESSGPAADDYVDQGDLFANQVTVSGTIYNGDPGTPALLTAGDQESDASAAGFQIATGSVAKGIYAINGQDPANYIVGGQIHLAPGDAVTYHLTYSLITSDFEAFRLDDYLPLPVLDVDDVGAWTFDGAGTRTTSFATAPATGHIRLTDSDTFTTYSGLTPSITADSAANSVSFVYSEFHSTSSPPTTIDLVFTVTVSSDPFADGLYLTNQVRAIEDGTPGVPANTDSIVQIVLDEPVLTITKGVVESGSEGDGGSPGIFSDPYWVAHVTEPGTPGFRFDAPVTSALLAAHPMDSNLAGIDAGDRVTFAIVVENTGHSGAFDISLTDVVPVQYALATTGLNLSVTDGAGSPLGYTLTNVGAISTLTIEDDGDGALAGIDGASGSNILVVTFDVLVTSPVQPLQVLTNTATLNSYAGTEGGPDHTVTDPSDTASVTINTPQVVKTLIGTSESSTAGNNVVIGETVTYAITITVPEGTSSGVSLTDTLDPGLAIVSLDDISASGALVSSAGAWADILTAGRGALAAPGNTFSLDLGTLTNGNIDNSSAETITVTYTAVVLNSAGNQQGTGLNNDADWHWTVSGTGQVASAAAPNVIVREPALQVVKDVWNPATGTWTNSANYDQADTNVQYRIIVQHSAASTEDAFDVSLNDTLPAGIDWSAATVSVFSGVAPNAPLDSVADGLFTASWDQLLSGQSTTFIISGGVLSTATAGQVIVNTGTATWQSLAGDPGQISSYNPNSTERTGSGGVNDYTSSDPATITVAGTIDKLQPAPASYTIGDTVTYDIVVTLPEGATNDLVITDALPAGMVYTGYNLITTSFGGTLTPTPTVNPAAGDGNDVTFSFGPVTVVDDNIATNNSFTLQVSTRVANVIGNQTGTGLPDHASMSYTNPLGGTTTIHDATDPAVTVIEPRITTAKSVTDSADAGSDAQPGETLTYTTRFTNSGGSTAFEVSAQDLLPAGVHFTGISSVASSGGFDTSATSVAIVAGSPASGETLAISGDWDIPVGGWVEVSYTVQVLAAGFTAGTYTNTVDADWSSRDGADPNERIYNDTPGYTVDGTQDQAQANFTVATTGSIGNAVFFDADGDSAPQETGEVGISGVRVTLTADVDGDGTPEFSQTVLTNGVGQYSFTNLAAFNNYVIAVDVDGGAGSGGSAFDLAGAGYTQTYDLNGPLDHSATVSLAAGQSRDDVDFGYTGQNSVGDTVWFDVNANGLQDAGEDGIGGLAVAISADIDGDGSFEFSATDVTDGSGAYGFEHLPAGNYVVTVTPPAGSVPTYDQDSGTGSPNHSTPFSLGADQDRDDIDFGLRGVGSLGDTVWFDSNADGSAAGDATEPGISGLTVTLAGDIDGDGTTDYTATATTDADGIYHFTNLLGGGYTVTVTPPAGMNPTYDLNGTGTPNTTAVTLPAGAANDNVDFGYTGTGAIGDRIWVDADGDGVQDAGEIGLAAVAVTVSADIDGDGAAEYQQTVLTDASGSYQFGHLPPSVYTVSVNPATLPAGMVQTYDFDGLGSAHAAVVTLALGESNQLVDFGYTGTGAIGDRVWSDADGDGVQDAGESGLAGVTVTLTGDLDHDGAADDTLSTTTAADGSYHFANLAAGGYTVAVTPATLPAGVVATYDLDGTGTLHTAGVTLAAGETNNAVDFGYRQTGTIGDTIWFDIDADGVQDAGEPGLVNINVTLQGDIDGDGAADDILTTSTDANGQYFFTNLPAGLPAGDYVITVQTATLPAGLTPTFDLDGTGTPHTTVIALAAGSANLTGDFGYTGTGSIGDRIWSDADGDGVQDPGEGGIAGVTVTLTGDLNNDGLANETLTTVTGPGGSYAFPHLPAGEFTIAVTSATLPSGASATYDADGTGTLHSAVVTLGAGEINTSVDFGYRLPPAPPEPPRPSITPPPATRPPEPALPPTGPEFAFDALFMRREAWQAPNPAEEYFRLRSEEFWRAPVESSFPSSPLAVAPLYTGHAEPGTTLTLTLYDTLGNAIGSQTVMADTAGNWLANFAGSQYDDMPHDMRLQQVAAAYNHSSAGAFNTRVYFNPAFDIQVFSTTERNAEAIFAAAPSTLLESMSTFNHQPLALSWDDFYGYEFFVTSTNPSQHGQ